MVIPASDQDVSAVTRYLSPYTNEDSLKRFLRLYGSINETRSAVSPYMVQRATESFEEAYGIWTGAYR
ncbi:MAG TPA: hypothetical protein VF884_01755, partial [Nitrososphaeraceae archaeon]